MKKNSKDIILFICTILSAICTFFSARSAHYANEINERQAQLQEELAKPIINFDVREENRIKVLKIMNNGQRVEDFKIRFISPYINICFKDKKHENIQVPIFSESGLYTYEDYGAKTGVIASINKTDLVDRLIVDLSKIKDDISFIKYYNNFEISKITIEYSFGIEYEDIFGNTIVESYNYSTGDGVKYLDEETQCISESFNICKLPKNSSILSNNEEIEKLDKKTGCDTSDSKLLVKAIIYDNKNDDDFSIKLPVKNILESDCFKIKES